MITKDSLFMDIYLLFFSNSDQITTNCFGTTGGCAQGLLLAMFSEHYVDLGLKLEYPLPIELYLWTPQKFN